MNSISEQCLLEVTISFLLGEINELVENLECLWLLLGVEHGFDEPVEVPASPVEVEVVLLLKQV